VAAFEYQRKASGQAAFARVDAVRHPALGPAPSAAAAALAAGDTARSRTASFKGSIMKPHSLFAALMLCLSSLVATAADGLLKIKSPHSAKDTMNRLEALVKERGLNVFARIDHAGGAARVGKTLRPTELLIFGNPQGGTPLMECAQSMGIDLPLKALVWEDAAGQVWLGTNDSVYLAKRHEVPACAAAAAVAKALESLAQAAVAP
jgi:uncharacterized protein (DUF302 family)